MIAAVEAKKKHGQRGRFFFFFFFFIHDIKSLRHHNAVKHYHLTGLGVFGAIYGAILGVILGYLRRFRHGFAFYSLRLNGTRIFVLMRYLPPKGVAKVSYRTITVQYRTVTVPLIFLTHVHLRVLFKVNPRTILYGYACCL